MTNTTRHLLALVTTIAVGILTPAGVSANVREPSSGESFTEARGDQSLLGVGIRKRWGFKVYAMGLYAERTGATRLGAGDYRGVVSGGFKKTVEIRLLRSISADKLRSAFEDALGGRVGSLPEYQQFLSYFAGELDKGTVITLQTAGPQLDVSIGGQRKPTLRNPKLTGALLDVWLGPKPVDSDLKETLVSRLGKL